MNLPVSYYQEALRRILSELPVYSVFLREDREGYAVTEAGRITEPNQLCNRPELVAHGRIFVWGTYTTAATPVTEGVCLLMACECPYARLSAEQVESAVTSWQTLINEHMVEVLKDARQASMPPAAEWPNILKGMLAEIRAEKQLHEDPSLIAARKSRTEAMQIAREQLTKAAGLPDHAYLAKRFDCDETNLWCLTEEAGEVVRSCGKLGRWGYDHVHQITGESGMRLLEAEVGDFLACVEIMIARGHFTREAIHTAVRAKLTRLEDWYEAPLPGGDPEAGTTYDA